MNHAAIAHVPTLPLPRLSGFYSVVRITQADLARAELAAGRSVTVVALCAERALIRLGLNPGRFDAFDVGPVDARDPLNTAHYYRVRPRLPAAR